MIALKVEQLIKYAGDNLYLKAEDSIYIRNQLFDVLKITEPYEGEVDGYGKLQADILDPLLDYAVEKGLVCDTMTDKILFETRLMGLVSPLPSIITEQFEVIAAKQGVKKATDFLYDFSCKSNYIRMVDINKNVRWEMQGDYGKIVVTINRSKPEKDPKEIELAKNTPKGAYPKCVLCKDNVGLAGDANKAARQTLRTIPIIMGDKPWQLQFSPYVYYPKHCIALSDEHYPMSVDRNAFIKMFDFCETFNHYFIGSNAALPIVGGSILAHDHYQGGDKALPMFEAKVRAAYDSKKYKAVKLSTLDWYNSVVRLESKDREQLIDFASHVFALWQAYSDEDAEIKAFSGDTPHNAVTPIARLEDDGTYILDMILRNNRTDETRPFGIFHSPQDLHNIKKEGIGIIEVMGLFILPGRLYEESHEIVDYLSSKKELKVEELFREEHILYKHAQAVCQLANDNGLELTREEAQKVVTEFINKACQRILEATAVFKNDEVGRKQFEKFIKSVI